MAKKSLFKRVLLAISALFVAAAILAAAIVYSWTNTPHGKLEARLAIMVHVMEWMPHASEIPLEELRAMYAPGGDELPVHAIENRTIPGPDTDIPIRIYTPVEQDDLPILVFYHGGAFILGGLDMYDQLCRRLAHASGAIVVSVDYRLAPEHPFPAAVDDSYAALKWVARHAKEIGGSRKHIAVGGDSAGGNLAAVTALRARDRRGPRLDFQLLIYPTVNLSAFDTQSHKDFAKGYLLDRALMDYLVELYVPGQAATTDPELSPLLAKTHRKLPPALVITAAFDPLRDEGEQYAEALREDGVDARASRYEEVIHGFLLVDFLSQSEEAIDESGAALRAAFGAY